MNTIEMPAIFRPLCKWLICFIAVGIIHCGDQVAGTSVGTENPDILALTFVRDGTPTRFTGRIEVYTENHNPIIDSLPIATFQAFEEDTIHLAGDSLLPGLVLSGLVRPGHDTVLAINVLGLDENESGALLSGLAFEYRRDRVFPALSSRQGILDLAPLTDYRSSLNVQEKESITNYVAIFGTPYFTLVRDGAFKMESMVPGRYEIQCIPYNRDVPASGDSIWLPIYSVNGFLDTDVEREFEVGDVEEMILVPKNDLRQPE